MMLGVFLANIVFLELFLVECRTRGRSDSKIVGGTYVRDIREMPWIVDIKNGSEKGDNHFCGGSVLTPIFVLTACHCLAQVSDDWKVPSVLENAKDYVFVAGSLISGDRPGKHAQVRIASSISIHPKCREINQIMRYDFGIAFLTKPFIENKWVRRISILSTDGETFTKSMYKLFAERPAKPCYVAGWGEVRRGSVGDSSVMSKKLRKVKMYIISETKCRQLFGRQDKALKYFPFTKNQQICATGRKNWGSDCQGDSGGPFICGGYQVGVVSYGIDCGISLPAVYAGLGIFFEWYSNTILPKYARGKLRKVDSSAGWRIQTPHFKIYVALFICCKLYSQRFSGAK
ncbi:hypothetical protein GE061_005609 [Apolygus lucorum]|uniref:Uncharacterized protein n=1 Tax=Apolygus lucorum TaxID=248454 RepID=A0A6A4IZE8_APOLU|nr:hypothetical protein GE061_005609 [Apolygus lucorum]